MVEIPRSSFIPREASMTPGVMRKKRTFHIFGFIASVLLVCSLLLAGGVYVLKQRAEKQRDEARNALAEQRGEFEFKDVEALRSFSWQLKAADLLLAHHISPLRIFDALERNTSRNVQITSFDFTHDPGFQALLNFQGKTSEFTTLTLQLRQFAEDIALKNVVISSLEATEDEKTDEEGESTASPEKSLEFMMTGEVDLSAIAFTGGLPVRTGGASVETTPAPTPAPSTPNETPTTPQAGASTSGQGGGAAAPQAGVLGETVTATDL